MQWECYTRNRRSFLWFKDSLNSGDFTSWLHHSYPGQRYILGHTDISNLSPWYDNWFWTSDAKRVVPDIKLSLENFYRKPQTANKTYSLRDKSIVSITILFFPLNDHYQYFTENTSWQFNIFNTKIKSKIIKPVHIYYESVHELVFYIGLDNIRPASYLLCTLSQLSANFRNYSPKP